MVTADGWEEKLVAQFGALADALGKTVSMARVLAAGGRPVELDGLDRHVGLLCAKALDLPPELGRDQRARLIRLQDEVDQLSALIRSNPTADQIPPPGRRRRNPNGTGH